MARCLCIRDKFPHVSQGHVWKAEGEKDVYGFKKQRRCLQRLGWEFPGVSARLLWQAAVLQ